MSLNLHTFCGKFFTCIRKKGNILFNNAHNIYGYGVRHIVKDYSVKERRNLLPSHHLMDYVSFRIFHIPLCLLLQLLSTGWKEKCAKELSRK